MGIIIIHIFWVSGNSKSDCDWNPILDYTVEDVWDCHDEHRFPRHEAYTGYGSTRVSCVFCIMASRGDLNAGVSCSDNHQLYRAMVQLERASTFHFQSGLWLGDIAPHLLDTPTRSALAEAKERAALREAAEQRIPRHLLSTKGWPTCMPTPQEARVLAEVRRDVAAAVGLDISYDDAESIRHRYTDLLAKKGNSNTSSATLSAVHEELLQLCGNDEQRRILDEDMERFAHGYKDKYQAVLRAKARTANPMITGSAKFDTQRNQKALNTEYRRCVCFLT